MIKRNKFIKCTIIALGISFLIGVIAFTNNLLVSTYRNGEEYCDAFYNGQILEQEIILNRTNKLDIDILAHYQQPLNKAGVSYTLEYGEEISRGFVTLSDLPNRQWTSIKIPADMFYYGPAKLTLLAVGLDQEDTVQFLITTNTLQKNAELTLQKDGKIIPNGRLFYSYKSWNFMILIISMLIGFVISFILILIGSKIIMTMQKYPLVFLLSGIFFVTMFVNFPTFKYINKHVSAQYFLSWKDLGFVRRALIGTVIDLLNLKFDKNAYIFYGIVSIAIMFALELIILYDKRHLSQQRNMQKCFLIFLSLPFTTSAFFNTYSFARLDQILIIVFLLSCITVIKERGIWLVPLISVLAILVHEMYLSSFIPFIFCILLYKWYISKQNKYIHCLIVTSVTSLVSGIYVSFFAKAAIPFEEAWARIQATGDPELIWDFPLHVEYYMPLEVIKRLNYSDILQSKLIPLAGIVILLICPIILLVVSWFVQFWKLQSDTLGRLIVLIFPCTMGGLIISMAHMCDWGRLFIMYRIGILFMFLTIWSMDQRVGEAVSKVWGKVVSLYGTSLLPILCFFYFFISISVGGATPVSPTSTKETVTFLFYIIK